MLFEKFYIYQITLIDEIQINMIHFQNANLQSLKFSVSV